jgi:RNA polymerase sigma factor (sigma-70 family)
MAISGNGKYLRTRRCSQASGVCSTPNWLRAYGRRTWMSVRHRTRSQLALRRIGTSTVPDDEHLLEAAKAGDTAAFAAFYRRYVAALTVFFRARGVPTETAFDLTAETFAALIANLERFDPQKGSARGWLFAIATNELRQMWRRGRVEDKLRQRLKMEPLNLDDQDLRAVEAASDHQWLARTLAHLPVEERQAIERRVIDEAGYDQLAQELDTTQSAVRQRVSRGLRRLRAAHQEQR